MMSSAIVTREGDNPMSVLVIRVCFDDASDFDFYRARFVGAVEAEIADALDDSEAPHADGAIELSWDTEDDDNE